MLESHTAIVERDVTWCGDYATEPYEVAWAQEAIVFVHAVSAADPVAVHHARVQISPDGRYWCDEGSGLTVGPVGKLSFVKLVHFGGWLRLAGSAPQPVRAHVYLALKG